MQNWQTTLERWERAGLLDVATAGRIRAFEQAQEQPGRLRWQSIVALVFGAVMVASGILLFVASHWDELSPAARFSIVLAAVAIPHVLAALFRPRFHALGTALHAVGTVALGGGIFVTGQIFNLEEHWPSGILLWAVGAAIGWLLLRDLDHTALVALLAPAWLASEWSVRMQRYARNEQLLWTAIFMFALTYLSVLTPEHRTRPRAALAWIGGLAIIPTAAAAMPPNWNYEWYLNSSRPLPLSAWFAISLVAVGGSLGLAWWLRRGDAWLNAVAAAWIVVLVMIPARSDGGALEPLWHYAARELGPYVWAGLASIGLVLWGLREKRPERINLGLASFGITMMVFYFSEVMDKLGRSASLIGFGILFLLLGWSLERTRRTLGARVKGAAA